MLNYPTDAISKTQAMKFLKNNPISSTTTTKWQGKKKMNGIL